MNVSYKLVPGASETPWIVNNDSEQYDTNYKLRKLLLLDNLYRKRGQSFKAATGNGRSRAWSIPFFSFSSIFSQVQRVESISSCLFHFKISFSFTFDLFTSASVARVLFTALFYLILQKNHSLSRPRLSFIFHLPRRLSSRRALHICLHERTAPGIRSLLFSVSQHRVAESLEKEPHSN
jgi:hypothetical protein